MHPAKSVILFTVLSGAGFGLVVMLGAGYPVAGGALGAAAACGLALGLSGVGLVCSTFHLGHPERAWRALSQWRSSWLSREGVAALVTLALFFAYAAAWVLLGRRLALLGALSAVSALATTVATAMIYAQLKTVPHWRTLLTPACFLTFSLTCGLVIASAASRSSVAGAPVSVICAAALIGAWTLKAMWWRRAARASLAASGSTPETATGLGAIGKVRLLERPHTGPNYLTNEMVHRIGRKHAGKLRRIALLLGALAPVVICGLVFFLSTSPLWQGVAALSLILGLLVERWLFFAEAHHSVSLYY